jgi:hypothetical protein
MYPSTYLVYLLPLFFLLSVYFHSVFISLLILAFYPPLYFVRPISTPLSFSPEVSSVCTTRPAIAQLVLPLQLDLACHGRAV